MSEAEDRYLYDVTLGYVPPSAIGYINKLKEHNEYLIEALIKEVKQSYEDTGGYSNLSMQVLQNITKKTKEEILK